MVQEKVVEKVKEVVVAEAKQIPMVEEVPLEAHDRQTGYKAIVNKSNMETLCVIPTDNQIVQHTHVLKEVEKLDNYIVHKTQLLKNGNLLMIELKEREPKQVELLPKDYLEACVYIFNDYTRSRGMSVLGGGTRIVCENQVTSLVKKQSLQVFAYGTSEFHTELETQIEKTITAWAEKGVKEVMEKANKTVVSIKDVMNELPKIPKKYMEKVTDKLKDQDTVYNIWNQYTQIITHEIAPHVREAKRLSLEKRANKILKLAEVPHE